MLQALPLEAELKTLSLSADQTLCAVGGRGLLGVCKIIGRVPVAQQQSQIFNSYIQSAKELEVFAAAIDAGFDGGSLAWRSIAYFTLGRKTRKTCPSPATVCLSTLALIISLPPGLRMEPWYFGM